MTSNPHPEHGPLWVERNSRRSAILARPHALMCGVTFVGSLYPHQADAIEPQIAPLPDGVYRRGDEFRLGGGYDMPDGWEDVLQPLDRRAKAFPRTVRRIPAEPPTPPTEDVPWWEALRDERLLPGDLGTRCISTGFVGGRRWVGEGDAVGSYLNPDGTVTVQAQGAES